MSSVHYGNYENNTSYSSLPASYRHRVGTSFSAIPKVCSNVGAPRFRPFFSPPALNFRPAPTDQFRSAYEGFHNRFRITTDPVYRKDYEESISEAFSVGEGSEHGQDHDRGQSIFRGRKEPVSLHMWIISPVEDKHEICVEGKRRTWDEEFWHSDVISKRLDEKTVMTVTGSIYRLEGNMELMDAMAVGFSRSLVEAFWLGFPPDWKALIDNHFKTASRLKEAHGQTEQDAASEVETDDDVSFVDSISVENSLAEETSDGQFRASTRPPPDKAAASTNPTKPPDKLDEVDGDDIRSVSEDEEDDILMSEEAEDHHQEAEIVVSQKVTKPPKTLEAKEHSLSKWIIKFLANGKGIYVIGEKENGSLWHSSAIEKRLSKKKVLSCTGSVYKLVGKMDKLLALNEDIPIEFQKKFQDGFPKEWQEIIQDHIIVKSKTGKQSIVKDKSKDKVEEKAQGVTKSKTIKGDKNNNKNNKSVSKKPVQSDKKSTQLKTARNRSKTRKITKKMKDTETENYESANFVITPRGQLVDLNTLGRSRSGRLIKPPLHGWARQELHEEKGRLVVKASTAASSQFLKQFEEQYRKTTRKIQPFFNPRQKNVDYSLLGPRRTKNTTLSTTISIDSNIGENSAESNNGSSSEAQLSEEEDQSDCNLKSAVTSILEKNRSQRKQNKQKRQTCYNSAVLKKKDSGSKQTYELDESCASNDRIQMNVDIDTDDTDEDCTIVRHQTRQRRRDSASENIAEAHKPTTRQRGKRSVSKRQSLHTNTTKTLKLSNNSKYHSDKSDLESMQVQSKCCTNQKKVLKVPLIDINDGNLKNKLSARQKPTKQSRKQSGRSTSVSGRRRSSIDVSDHNEDDNECSIDNEEEIVTRRRSGRVQQKQKPVYVDLVTSDNDTDKEERKRTVRGKSKGRACKSGGSENSKRTAGSREIIEKAIEDCDDQWTQEEKQRLYRACKIMAVNDVNYWDKVADMVVTKSADSCNKMYYQSESNKPTSKAKNDKKEKPRATSVTANSGTLKRKQQIKDVLKQQNENHSEDLFDSTPFRKTRKRKIPLMADEGDGLFDKIARLQGKNFETPRGPVQKEGSTVRSISSPVPTPGTHLKQDSPAVGRDMEGYVHNILKKQKTRGRKKKSIDDTPNPKQTVKDKGPSEKLFYKILNESQGDKENHEDSENEADYYFEGDEESATEVSVTS